VADFGGVDSYLFGQRAKHAQVIAALRERLTLGHANSHGMDSVAEVIVHIRLSWYLHQADHALWLHWEQGLALCCVHCQRGHRLHHIPSGYGHSFAARSHHRSFEVCHPLPGKEDDVHLNLGSGIAHQQPRCPEVIAKGGADLEGLWLPFSLPAEQDSVIINSNLHVELSYTMVLWHAGWPDQNRVSQVRKRAIDELTLPP